MEQTPPSPGISRHQQETAPDEKRAPIAPGAPDERTYTTAQVTEVLVQAELQQDREIEQRARARVEASLERMLDDRTDLISETRLRDMLTRSGYDPQRGIEIANTLYPTVKEHTAFIASTGATLTREVLSARAQARTGEIIRTWSEGFLEAIRDIDATSTYVAREPADLLGADDETESQRSFRRTLAQYFRKNGCASKTREIVKLDRHVCREPYGFFLRLLLRRTHRETVTEREVSICRITASTVMGRGGVGFGSHHGEYEIAIRATHPVCSALGPALATLRQRTPDVVDVETVVAYDPLDG